MIDYYCYKSLITSYRLLLHPIHHHLLMVKFLAGRVFSTFTRFVFIALLRLWLETHNFIHLCELLLLSTRKFLYRIQHCGGYYCRGQSFDSFCLRTMGKS